MVVFDDFRKLDLRVARIVEAKRVENSEKLLKLKIDIGEKDAANLPAARQVIAGIGRQYAPEDIIGKEIIVIANLEPKILMGCESQGMLLAADSAGGPVLLMPDKEVALGTKIC